MSEVRQRVPFLSFSSYWFWRAVYGLFLLLLSLIIKAGELNIYRRNDNKTASVHKGVYTSPLVYSYNELTTVRGLHDSAHIDSRAPVTRSDHTKTFSMGIHHLCKV